MGYVSLTVLIFGTLKFCDTWERPFISIPLLIPTMILKMDPIFFFEPSFPFHAVSFINNSEMQASFESDDQSVVDQNISVASIISYAKGHKEDSIAHHVGKYNLINHQGSLYWIYYS